MEFKEVTEDRKFTLELTEREAGVLKNILGICGGECTFVQRLYDSMEEAGVKEFGNIECDSLKVWTG